MGKKRITKKKLKEDAFVSGAFEASHFVQEHLTRIILGVVGFLILVGMVWVYTNYRRERAGEAKLALFKAQSLYLNGQYALAASDFERVAEEFSGTVDADKAVFFSGDAHYKAGDLDLAQTRFEECREIFSRDDPLLLNAIIGLAAVYEELEQYDRSIEAYREAFELAAYDYQKLLIMDGMSRVMAMAGRNQEALEAMDWIIENYPDSPNTGTVIERKAELLARYYAEVESNN